MNGTWTLALALALAGCGRSALVVDDEDAEGVTLLLPERCRSECDPAAGEVSGKDECDDAEAHTADRCVDAGSGCGVCAHIRVVCDGFDNPAVQAAVCDDGDPCSTDRCFVSECVHTPVGECSPG